MKKQKIAFRITSYSGDVIKDTYENGEEGDFLHDFEVEYNETCRTKKELIEAANKIIGTDYEEKHFDWETGEGKNYQTDVLTTTGARGEINPATKEQIAQWKQNKKTLYTTHYCFHITPIIETEENLLADLK
jgi:hypothetical protein